MKMIPELICCTGGNDKFYKIANIYGFKYGARLPTTIRGKLYFADQNWKSPDRKKYMNALKINRPTMATVIDYENHISLDEVISWAMEASEYVDNILVVPKVSGTINEIPLKINEKNVIFAYSVPSKYGRTDVPIEEFYGKKVHILGGSPFNQGKLFLEIYDKCEVTSIDGNYWIRKATNFCSYFSEYKVDYAKAKHWPMMRESGYGGVNNAYIEAFRRSCKNVMFYWKNIFNSLEIK